MRLLARTAVIALALYGLLAALGVRITTRPAEPSFTAPTGRHLPLTEWTDGELDEAIRAAQNPPSPPR